MPQPILIFSGEQHEAYRFANENKLTDYAVITDGFHLRKYERGSVLVLAGTWAAHPAVRRVRDEAGKRGMAIQTEGEWAARWKSKK